ncbi:hypothetical protein [Synoicihabitans lomoniglobus]|uniref:Quinol:cytochrome C oxidoreductase n=1 Tax=Synoicihabitans lomoniglobus TaxID=2909285 RepID=A0AAF0CR08_9BACT|nr:hypothetical protein [Opitutaceae bacterium LMO-M01]WED66475.1 hypothetical protein PXH66_06390 [Opitutaceae bacterium LMO-M01]
MSASNTNGTPAGKALIIGIVGIALTAVGIAVSGGPKVAFSWLTAMTFWTGIAIGMLMLIMIHHIFDANWSTVIRRQFEHGISAFKWLALLFVPLIVASFIDPSILWKYFDPSYNLADIGGHGTVGEDVLWVKKSVLLNPKMFLFITIGSFLGWIFLSSRFRRNSFTQDGDGDIKWTTSSRKWSAAGIPFTAFALTFCVIFWVKALDYHWFSTMYGVWFFANCVRAALAIGILIMCWLWTRGDYKGVLNTNHWYSIGMLSFAFTVFWAYVTFSQYFLIWNANVPEETFWYNLREINNSTGEANQWKWIGMLLLFGHFFFPFLGLISYPAKISKKWMKFMATWILLIVFVDMIYNVWPSKKVTTEMVETGHGFGLGVGDPLPFLAVHQLWTFTALIGIGGICAWAYFKSFPTAKLIPIRDPRIGESLTYHE